jgi:hypothetical protein
MADASEDLLAKAKEAEAQATLTTNPKIKASWLQIAEGYRRLAQQVAKGQPHQGD